MNKIELIGRLTKDPEIRQNGDNTVARYTLAVDRKFKRENEHTADFLPCIAFGKTAEFVEKYFHKGNRMALTGRVQTNSYTNKEGQKVYTTDVIVEEVEFCESKSESTSAKSESKDDDFANVDEDIDELPFN